METITREELDKLGGAPDASFAVFREDGDLYFCTTSPAVKHDENFWKSNGFTVKEVIE